MPNEESTTKLNIDISELKKSMQDAKRAVSVANSEFKASVSTLENWAQTTEGVGAKIKQLNSNVESHEKILEALEEQYKAVVAEQGENSKAAQNLEIKINNQKATVNKTVMELHKYEQQLESLVTEQKKSEQATEQQTNAYDELKNTISDQESELESLKKEYASVALEQGKNSDAAGELADKIEKLSSELKVNQDIMSKADKAADDLDNSLDDVGDAAEKAKEGFTIMKGAISDLIADGLKALAQSAKDCMQELVFETGKAYDTFQGKTGTATEAMGEFEDAINDLYRNNYGESITDIADSMAEIKQQTNEINPSKLQELTKNSLVLRDTFEFEVKESMRAVKMLMDEFGVSGEEAYNLIVQGAQKGLNKNDDLLDTINEYSVHYKQLGYDSEEFFNSLLNGAKEGTFSVDKLGDAVKEFGIRVKDGSDSSAEAFESLGLNAKELTKEFSKGGESAKKATQKTLKALFEMDDEVKQNQVGVALFGTMWEDLGVDSVKALMNTNGELKKTNKAMKELDSVAYDNVASKFAQIGRTLQMDLLLPLAEKALPTVEKFADKCITNSDEIINKLKVIGGVIATVFVVNKVATFTQSIITMVQAYQSAKTAIQAADAAQKLFNITQGATPWGAVALAIGVVVGGLITYAAATKDAKSDTDKLLESLEAENKKMTEQANAYKEAEKARTDTLKGIDSEFNYYSQLADELQKITDENGKVKEGYESRADTITGILSKALGEEIDTDKLVADGKQKVIDKIKELIEVKRAQAMLDASYDDYTKAMDAKDGALTEYLKRQKESEDVSKKLAKAEKELEEASKKTTNTIGGGAGQYAAAASKVADLREAQKLANDSMEKAQESFLGYQNTIATYEGVSAAIIEGDSAKINEALILMSNGFKTAENSTKQSLEAQVKAAKDNLALLKQALKDGEPGVTQQMVDNAKIMVDRSVAELGKFKEQGAQKGAEGGQAFADSVAAKSGEAEKAGTTLADSANKGEGSKKGQSQTEGTSHGKYFAVGVESNKLFALKSGTALADDANKGEGSKKGQSQTEGTSHGKYFTIGLGSNKTLALNSGLSLAENANKGEGSKKGQSQNEGESHGGSFVKGVSSKDAASKTAGTGIANKANEGAKSVKGDSAGADFGNGFVKALTSGTLLQSIWNAAWGLGKKALAALKSAIDSNSPAKETIDIGEFFGEGYVIGIENLIRRSEEMAEKLGTKSLDAIKGTLDDTYTYFNDKLDGYLESEQKYLEEKARIEKEKADREYDEKIKNAKSAEEVEKIKQDRINKEADAANKVYLDNLKDTADQERKLYEKRINDAKKFIEKVKSGFDAYVDDAMSKINEYKSFQQSIADSLKTSDNLTYSKITFTGGNSSNTITKLANIDNGALTQYNNMLDKLKERRGDLPTELANYLSSMGLADGMAYVEAMLNASDKEFDDYLNSLEERSRLTESISKKVTFTQGENLKNELIDRLAELPAEFLKIGEDSAVNFGDEFLNKMGQIIVEINNVLSSNLENLMNGSTSKVAKNILSNVIDKISSAGYRLSEASTAMLNSTNGYGPVINNYTQVINSPKTPSRIDLYRDGKNLLGLKSSFVGGTS